MVMMAPFRAVPRGRQGAGRSSDLNMIGLVLVTHGRLAVEFRAALEHVVGEQKQIETVMIGPDDDVEQRRRDIIEAVTRADGGDGVVILTDMFGGTPSNLSISVMNRPNVEVLAGSTCRCW
jgi:PTS system mannose-specific IIA component